MTIVELLPRIVPNGDEEVSAQLERSFRRQGIQVSADAQVQGIAVNNGTASVSILSKGESTVLDADIVLVAVGVEGNTDGIGLDTAGVEVDRSFIPIDDMMNTNVNGIYAIGDVTGKMLLAHVASAQGVTAIEHIAGLNPQPLDYNADSERDLLPAPGGQLRHD